MTFSFPAFFSLADFTGCSLTFTAEVDNFFLIQLSIGFVIFCSVQGLVFLFMGFVVAASPEVGQDCLKGLLMPKIVYLYHVNDV